MTQHLTSKTVKLYIITQSFLVLDRKNKQNLQAPTCWAKLLRSSSRKVNKTTIKIHEINTRPGCHHFENIPTFPHNANGVNKQAQNPGEWIMQLVLTLDSGGTINTGSVP